MHQVTAGAHSAMFVNAGNNVFIDKGGQQFNKIGMDSGMSLHQAVQSGQQDRAAEQGRELGPTHLTGVIDNLLGGKSAEPQAYLLLNYNSALVKNPRVRTMSPPCR